MSTATTNLALQKPTVGGDANVWGTLLNGNADILDAALGAFGNTAGTATAKGIVTFESQQKGKLYASVVNPGTGTISPIQRGLVIVYGSNGAGVEFQDIIAKFIGARTVLDFKNVGSTPTRTYGDDGSAYLTCSITGGAAGTYTINAIAFQA